MEVFLLLSELQSKRLLQNVCNFYQQVQNWFWKQEMESSEQEMESSEQEMELFFLLSELQSKNIFNKMFLIFTTEFETGF